MTTEKTIYKHLKEFGIDDNCYAGQREFPGMMLVLSKTRDSDCLTESNFRSALKELGGEKESEEEIEGKIVDLVTTHRFNHWACGRYEVLLVREGTTQAALADELLGKLEDYPVVNEDDFSELESETANTVWKDCYSWKERIEYIREHRSQFEFHDFADLMQNVRGEYFSGYANELVS